MITVARGAPTAEILAQVVAHPGELAPRRICVGRICVAELPQVENPPPRWADRMREAGVLRPARVRRMPHIEAPRLARLEGAARVVMGLLLDAGDDGLEVAALALAVSSTTYPSGALEETLQGLYRDGYASPPAALWATAEGLALVASWRAA